MHNAVKCLSLAYMVSTYIMQYWKKVMQTHFFKFCSLLPQNFNKILPKFHGWKDNFIVAKFFENNVLQSFSSIKTKSLKKRKLEVVKIQRNMAPPDVCIHLCKGILTCVICSEYWTTLSFFCGKSMKSLYSNKMSQHAYCNFSLLKLLMFVVKRVIHLSLGKSRVCS